MFVSAAAGGKARTLSFDLTSVKARLALCVALFVLLGQVVAFMLGAAASPQGSASGLSPATASISALAQGVGQAIALCEHVPSQDQADGNSAPGSHPHHSDCPFCPSAQAGALGALARVALVVPVRVPTHLDLAFEPRIWPTAHDLPAVHAPRGPPTLA